MTLRRTAAPYSSEFRNILLAFRMCIPKTVLSGMRNRGPHMKFGDYLRQKREEKNWTQPEASAAAGIEQSYLSKLETGKSWPSEDVFARVASAYGIDVDDMVRHVASSELSRLREIAAVRSAILEIQNGQRVASRGWLIACLLCLVASGACFGVMLMGKDTVRLEVVYRSLGVLATGEPLEAFDIVQDRLNPGEENYAALEARRQQMLKRVDERILKTGDNRGFSIIEKVEGGLRHYRRVNDSPVWLQSPLRWFIVPALMLLAGAIGSAFISFRWK
jgi:transcriptional regulator with XRE-family HTH domain